jgi:outer membrane protein OmpA-like peptidoglycan-associated protein
MARALDTAGRLPLPDVTFAGRTADLARDAGLVDLAQVLAAAPGLEIRLEGYTDATGDAAGDLRLSVAMAQAAQRRLIDLGVDPARIGAGGRGGENPLLPNFTARGRAGNRRVEVILAR